jgi:hypothetical protein
MGRYRLGTSNISFTPTLLLKMRFDVLATLAIMSCLFNAALAAPSLKGMNILLIGRNSRLTIG